MMKRISLFIIAAIMAFGLSQHAYAQTEPPTGLSEITEQITTVTNIYGALGEQIGGTSATHTVTVTRDPDDPNVVTTTTTDQIRILEIVAGQLKNVETANTTETISPDGAHSLTQTTTELIYDDLTGILQSVNGYGSMDRTNADDSSSTATITMIYEVRNQAPVLMSQITSGENFSAPDPTTGQVQSLGTFVNERRSDELAFMGNEWVTLKEVSTQAVEDQYGNTTNNTETIVDYARDVNGTMTGMLQDRLGYQAFVLALDPSSGEFAMIEYDLENYSATVAFDPIQGYYVQSDSYDLVRRLDDTGGPGGPGSPGDVPPTSATFSEVLSINTGITSSITVPTDGAGTNNFWIRVDFADDVAGNENFTVTIAGISANYSFTVVDPGTAGTVWINLGQVDIGSSNTVVTIGGGTTGTVIQIASQLM